MDNTITLSWCSAENSTEYFINDSSKGRDETGFKNVMKYISQSGLIRKIRVKYPATGPNDGREPQENFPFYGFYPEFLKVIDDKNMIVEFIPEF